MNNKEQTNYSDKMIEEVVDNIMKGIEDLSSDKELRRYVEKGAFSNGDFEWLARWSQLSESDRGSLSGTDRQHKLRAKRTIIQAIATITWAEYFQDAFSDEDWTELLPASAIYPIVYLSALRDGADGAITLATAIDAGLNEKLKAETGGALEAKVSVTLLPSSEKLMEINTKLGYRINQRLIEKAKEESLKSQ